jgi:hypothetical protein
MIFEVFQDLVKFLKSELFKIGTQFEASQRSNSTSQSSNILNDWSSNFLRLAIRNQIPEARTSQGSKFPIQGRTQSSSQNSKLALQWKCEDPGAPNSNLLKFECPEGRKNVDTDSSKRSNLFNWTSNSPSLSTPRLGLEILKIRTSQALISEFLGPGCEPRFAIPKVRANQSSRAVPISGNGNFLKFDPPRIRNCRSSNPSKLGLDFSTFEIRFLRFELSSKFPKFEFSKLRNPENSEPPKIRARF